MEIRKDLLAVLFTDELLVFDWKTAQNIVVGVPDILGYYYFDIRCDAVAKGQRHQCLSIPVG